MPSEPITNVLAKHPIRHDGKLHPRGAKLKLGAKDAESLQKLGYVEPVEGEEEESNASGLEGKTKQQLIDYALDAFKLTLDIASTKAQLIEAIVKAQAAPAGEGATS